MRNSDVKCRAQTFSTSTALVLLKTFNAMLSYVHLYCITQITELVLFSRKNVKSKVALLNSVKHRG